MIQREMLALASQLPEYSIVMRMFDIGPILDPQLLSNTRLRTIPYSGFATAKGGKASAIMAYMTAAANKFLRIYYGTVTAYLEKL